MLDCNACVFALTNPTSKDSHYEHDLCHFNSTLERIDFPQGIIFRRIFKCYTFKARTPRKMSWIRNHKASNSKQIQQKYPKMILLQGSNYSRTKCRSMLCGHRLKLNVQPSFETLDTPVGRRSIGWFQSLHFLSVIRCYRPPSYLVRFSISAGIDLSLLPPTERERSRRSFKNWAGSSSNLLPLKFSDSIGREPKSLGRDSTSSRLFLAISVRSLLSRVISSDMTESPLLLMSRKLRFEKSHSEPGSATIWLKDRSRRLVSLLRSALKLSRSKVSRFRWDRSKTLSSLVWFTKASIFSVTNFTNTKNNPQLLSLWIHRSS